MARGEPWECPMMGCPKVLVYRGPGDIQVATALPPGPARYIVNQDAD